MSCNSALSGYNISIILFIQNSLFPCQCICIFHCYAEAFFEVFALFNYQNMVKKALSQISLNHNSGHLVKLYATELNLLYGKYSFALHNLWLLPKISRNFSILHKITFL